MKRTISFITVLCMIVTLVASFGSVSANAASASVSLYYSDTVSAENDSLERDIYVKTDGNTYNQQVYVHYDVADGQPWADEQAVYLCTLSDGSKIWKATIVSDEDNTQYVIKYVANGNTYWDNNGGNNYSGTYATYDDLGCAPVMVARLTNPSYYFTSQVIVKLHNYAYEKNVFVRYTADGWETYSDVPMSYYSTNSDGTENWTASFKRPITCHDFEYCVCYQVNGQTYWANNFGENYGWDYRVEI